MYRSVSYRNETFRDILQVSGTIASDYGTGWFKAINVGLDAMIHSFEVEPPPVTAASRVIAWCRRLQALTVMVLVASRYYWNRNRVADELYMLSRNTCIPQERSIIVIRPTVQPSKYIWLRVSRSQCQDRFVLLSMSYLDRISYLHREP